MLVVPADTPLTTPVEDTIVALEVLLLLHVPPIPVLVRVVVAPVQSEVEPLIAPGTVFTVKLRVPEVEMPQTDVAVSVYTPAVKVLVVNADGTKTVDVKLFGPAQL